LSNKLYAVGGDEDGTIELYDDESESWSIIAHFPQFRKNFSVTSGEFSNFNVSHSTRHKVQCGVAPAMVAKEIIDNNTLARRSRGTAFATDSIQIENDISSTSEFPLKTGQKIILVCIHGCSNILSFA
jgi:hypothetical protein